MAMTMAGGVVERICIYSDAAVDLHSSMKGDLYTS